MQLQLATQPSLSPLPLHSLSLAVLPPSADPFVHLVGQQKVSTPLLSVVHFKLSAQPVTVQVLHKIELSSLKDLHTAILEASARQHLKQ